MKSNRCFYPISFRPDEFIVNDPKPNGLDSRLRGNDGAGGCRLKFRHSRENGNLELLIFQTTFEHCRYPMIWIPACAGMTM
ncbi:Uncharacterised protein [Neisseria meningitidis]|nr:Uncharacterised protein [Neisseria meningitidis]